LFKPFEKLLLKQAQAVIASTEEYFNYSQALKPFEEKCHFIPLAIKTRSTELDAKHLDWAQKKWRNAQYKIYNIGRLTFYKNHQLLLEAAQLLPQALFIITGSGELQQKLMLSIKQKQISNIILTGSLSIEKLDALMKTCDAFCLPSNDRAESFGMVLLEALNFNKPILVSNLAGSGMKWIASQTHLGHTFDCNDAKDLIRTIEDLSILKSNNKIKNTPFFHIQKCAHSIDQLYQLIAP
jgi:rhamnosyl/mannosyltransferase